MAYGFYVLVFIFGLVLGSFINVLISRLDKKGGLFFGRSECPKCLTQLRWYDLIPIVSYILLRGKCRYCRKDISIIYPVVELTVGLIFVAYFIINQPSIGWLAIYELFTLLMLSSLIFFDLLYLIIPDKIIITIVSTSVLYSLLSRRSEVFGSLLSGFILAAFFATIYLISKGEWLGLGDAKLALATGLILGYPLSLFAVIISIWTAALWGIGLLLLHKAGMKTALPFGSFLSVIIIIFIIFHGQIQEQSQFINLFL